MTNCKEEGNMCYGMGCQFEKWSGECGKPAFTLEKIFEQPAEEFFQAQKFLSTGLSDLDKKIIGFFGGELIVIAGRPGQGKSALALQIAREIAQRENVLFVSLEMSSKDIVFRMLATDSGVPINAMRADKMTEQEKKKVFEAYKRIGDQKLKMEFLEQFSITQIINSIKKRFVEKGLGCVFIDYLQIIDGNPALQRYLQVGEITRSLKLLAMELKIPIIVMAQLARRSENNIPRLSDLSESGRIDNDVDTAIFIHQPEERDKETKQLIIGKGRNTGTNMIDIYFEPIRFKFYFKEREIVF
jgi:replicative DNA helicase